MKKIQNRERSKLSAGFQKIGKKVLSVCNMIRKKVATGTAFFHQFVFTYLVMIFIFLVMVIIEYATATTTNINSYLELGVSIFIPTTITFVGVAMFTDDFPTCNRGRAAWVLSLIVGMALTYILFVCITSFSISNVNKKQTLVTIAGIFNIVLIFPAIFSIRSLAFCHTSDITKSTADGRVCSERR